MSYLFNVHALELYTSSSLTCDLDLYTLLLIHATHNQRLCPIHYQHQCHDCSSLRCSFYVDLSDLALIFNIFLSNLLPSALADLQGMQDGSTPANVKLQLLQYSTSINGDQESNWCNSERIQTHLVACMDIPTILPYFSLLVILSTFF